MQNRKSTEELVADYFQHSKKQTESEKLKVRIAQQTSKSTSSKLKRIVLPVAATVLLVLVFSIWTNQLIQKQKNKVPQSEVIYEDDDFIIYVKE